jgi:thiosulfate/3-mercaptopyruvate sulfurtransferase
MVMICLKLFRTRKIEDGKAIASASALALFLLLCLALAHPALAGTETGEFCPTCPDWTDMDGWLAKKEAYEQEQQQKAQLEKEAITLTTQNAQPAPVQVPPESNPATGGISRVWTGNFAQALVSPQEVLSDDIVLDISPSATRYIEGAVNINYERFFAEGGRFRSVGEIAELLGHAGISRNDSLVIAGECLPCGGGPSPAVFSYWILKYLGQEKVRVLDGSIEDWAAAGLNTSNVSVMRPRTDYIPALRPELLATYDFVVNAGAQIVDARPPGDFSIGSIPGAINIPFENVVEDETLRAQEDLEKVFVGLDKDRPVVVYTNVGIEASLVWFALTLSGYDARLYTWRDWLENQPKFGYELTEARAEPNPVRSGSTTTITTSFQEKLMATADNSSGDEIKLTIKGCSTCGFEGFALGTSSTSGNKSGTIQLSSSGKTSQSSAAGQDSALRCTAIVNAPDGSEAASTSLLRTSGYKFVGIWNAKVAPGIYKVSIAASASGHTETFEDVLEIEVTDKA